MAQLKDLIVLGNSRFIGDVYSDATFHLTKNTYPTLDTDNVALITGPSTGQNLTIARSSILARNNGSAYLLYLNERGGAVNIGATSGDLDVLGKLILNTITSTESDLPSIISASVKNTTTGKTYSSPIILAYLDHGSTPYGFNLMIGGGGNTVLGSGDSPINLYSAFIKNNTAENLYLISDGHIFLLANANTVGNRIGIMIHTNGSIYPQKASADNNGVSNLGSTSNRFKEGYFTNLIRVGTADTTTANTQYNNAGIDTGGFWFTAATAGSSYGYTLRGKGKNYANLYVDTLGIANTAGITILALGNNIASTAADNSNGTLLLYSNTTKCTSIKSSLEIKGNHLNYLPVYSATGTSTYYGRLVGIYKGTSSGSTGFSDVGSTSQPVYITANGVATPINYTIATSVPSGAVFTDEKVELNITTAESWRKVLVNGDSSNTYTNWDDAIVTATGKIYQSKSVAILPSTGILHASLLYAGNSTDTAERHVQLASAAGTIYMFAGGTTTGNRGIYVPATGTGAARYVIRVNNNNIVGFAGGLGSTASSTGAQAITSSVTGCMSYFYNVASATTGMFTASNNANAILTFNKYTSSTYCSLLGLSSNGNLYYRNFGNAAIDTTTAWKLILFVSTSSDIRLKNIQDIQLPDVSNIRAFIFKWKNNNFNLKNIEHIGYSALEIEKIAPFLIEEDENGYKTLNYIEFLCAKILCLEDKIKLLEEKFEK